tara:strand:- start:956 stop:2014 length:1059 start_codon:yes stop_codon:yes gene_type:complete
LSYIGKTPTVGNFIKLDDISTSSTNSYTLQHNSVNFSPESANHMLVSLNGVIQAPNTAFSVSGSTITFLPSSGTLSSSDSIDFIMVYGNVLDVGVATTVSDASITKAKMNLISDSSSAGLTIKGDGGSENGTLQLNCSANSHGIKLSSPSHASGQSYELIFPTGNVTADKVLKVASVSGSGATGVGQLSFGDAGGTNTPMFNAHISSDQTISDASATKLQFNVEDFDSDSAYDHSSNYRFTVPSGQAGKYLFQASTIDYDDQSQLQSRQLILYKNGSEYAYQNFYPEHDHGGTANSYMEYGVSLTLNVIVNCSVSDYFEVYYWGNTRDSGSFLVKGDASKRESWFQGHKLIT